MSAHVSGPLEQRCQRRLSTIGCEPVQLPSPAVSSPPATASPDRVGASVFAIGVAATAPVGPDTAVAAPPAPLDASTRTRSVWPMSASVAV